MRGSWKIGQVANIGIFVHWTFLILIGFFLLYDISKGASAATVIENVGFVLALFACVTLHELGHAMAAKRFGVKTRDITLLPIGGVARLERIPEDPRQEFIIAIAGPLVNVAIAAALFVLVALKVGTPSAEKLALDENLLADSFLVRLLAVNVMLVVFNLLPAFPMDGGRVLRAVLAHFTGDYVRATRTAAAVGQLMAILFVVAGLMGGNPMLLFIAFFVYLGAQGEAHQVQTQSVLRGVPVRAALMTRSLALSPDDPLRRAVDELLAGAQQDFPVVEGDRVVGMLPRGTLFQALSQGGVEQSVRQAMRSPCAVVEDAEMLDATFTRMNELGCASLPVTRQGRFVGMLSLENVAELMMYLAAIRQQKSPGTRATA